MSRRTNTRGEREREDKQGRWGSRVLLGAEKGGDVWGHATRETAPIVRLLHNERIGSADGPQSQTSEGIMGMTSSIARVRGRGTHYVDSRDTVLGRVQGLELRLLQTKGRGRDYQRKGEREIRGPSWRRGPGSGRST